MDNHPQGFRWFYLGDNLITSHQVDYMSSALILVEAVEMTKRVL